MAERIVVPNGSENALAKKPAIAEAPKTQAVEDLSRPTFCDKKSFAAVLPPSMPKFNAIARTEVGAAPLNNPPKPSAFMIPVQNHEILTLIF